MFDIAHLHNFQQNDILIDWIPVVWFNRDKNKSIIKGFFKYSKRGPIIKELNAFVVPKFNLRINLDFLNQRKHLMLTTVDTSLDDAELDKYNAIKTLLY